VVRVNQAANPDVAAAASVALVFGRAETLIESCRLAGLLSLTIFPPRGAGGEITERVVPTVPFALGVTLLECGDASPL
jgi:hypothetical protein